MNGKLKGQLDKGIKDRYPKVLVASLFITLIFFMIHMFFQLLIIRNNLLSFAGMVYQLTGFALKINIAMWTIVHVFGMIYTIVSSNEKIHDRFDYAIAGYFSMVIFLGTDSIYSESDLTLIYVGGGMIIAFIFVSIDLLILLIKSKIN